MKKIDRYIIIADESTKNGKEYSYFYGGALVLEKDYEFLSSALNKIKETTGLGELKRTKITEKNYKDYIKVLRLFFALVSTGDIKVRVMFSPNEELLKLPKRENLTYTKFYYAFIFNAFSIFYAKKDIRLRLIFDDLPETKEQCENFKNCIVSKVKVNDRADANKVYIDKQQIEEVDSKKHIILQCIDVIVGVFDHFLNTPPSELMSTKRAKARSLIFKFVLLQISTLHKNFIINKTTQPIYSHKGWNDKYKHFVYRQKKSPQHF